MHRPNSSCRRTLFCAALATLALISNATAQPDVDARPNERSAPRDTIVRTRYSDPIDIVSAGLEYVASAGGGDFFDEYGRLGGTQADVGAYLAPTIVARLALTDQLRITAYAGYHSARFEENYEVRRSIDPRARPVAGVAENFSVLAAPIIGGIEFAPLRTQFTSYVGVGAGLAITRSVWNSDVQFTNERYHRPRSNTESFGVAPTARAYAGVDLRFDRGSVQKAAFRGVFLEASYLFLPIRRDYFAELRQRGEGVEEAPETDAATLYLGGLSFTFGLNLQVLRR